MSKYGWFSPPVFNCVGDPYDRKNASTDDRHKGRQMQTAPPKKGKMPKTTFGPPLTLFEGEKYSTLLEQELAEKRQMAEKLAGGAPFKPANPTKKAAGLGSYYGAIGPKHEYVTQGGRERKKKGDYQMESPNMLTTGPKKGSYGTVGTTIGTYGTGRKAAGVVGEYTYKLDPYDGARQQEVESRKAAKGSEVGGGNPFKPANPAKRGTYGVPGVTISSNPYLSVKNTKGICGEYEYMPAPELPKVARKKGEEEEGPPPFKLPSQVKSGKTSTFSKFPEYVEDPFELEENKRREQIKKEMELRAGGAAFRPTNIPRSLPTVSIFQKNIDKE